PSHDDARELLSFPTRRASDLDTVGYRQVSWIINAGIFDVLQIKAAIVIVRNFTGVKVVAAKVAGGDDGICAGTAAGFVRNLMFGQVIDQLCLTRLIYQCHHTLGYRHGGEVAVLDGDFGINQCGAYAVDVVMSHGSL